MPFFRYLALSFLLFAALGCGSSHAGEDGGLDAIGTTDGSAGDQSAMDGAARPDGGSDAAIAPDTVVLPDSSTPDAGRPDGAIGTPCTTDVDCDGRFCAAALGYCTFSCASDAPCPGGEECVMFGGSVGLCLPGCDLDDASTCETGFACTRVPSSLRPVCLRGCDGEEDCPEGAMCQDRGAVVGRCFTPDVPQGSPCTTDADCALGTGCGDELRFGFPGGICLARCSPVGACTSGTSCVPNADDSPGWCLPNCDETDCRAGYACEPGPGDGAPICLPRCRADTDCSEDFRCQFITGRCVRGV